jgi:hypothetical protein
MPVTRYGLILFKVSVTAVLLWYLFGKIDLDAFGTQLLSMNPLWAIAALVALIAQLLLSGVRWHFVGRLVAAQLPILKSLRVVLVGQFFNQFLPSSIGGDAVKAWLASKEGMSLGRAVASVICDRAIGMIVLILIVFLALLIFPEPWKNDFDSSDKFVKLLAAATVGGLLVLLLQGVKVAKFLMTFHLTRPIGILIRDLRLVLFTNTYSLLIIGVSFLVQILVVLVICFIARSIGVELDFAHGIVLVPLIMLVATIPVSLAGWGIREGAMVLGLGFVGISATDSIFISVAFGLAQIIISLPGGLLWLLHSRR